jgi:hypothetical protein
MSAADPSEICRAVERSVRSWHESIQAGFDDQGRIADVRWILIGSVSAATNILNVADRRKGDIADCGAAQIDVTVSSVTEFATRSLAAAIILVGTLTPDARNFPEIVSSDNPGIAI